MNQSKVYAGNLSYEVTSEDLQGHFSQYGNIVEAKLVMDRDTGRSKGFAFITFESDDAAKSALAANDTELKGRKMRVNIARDNRDGDGGSRGSSGGGRGGYSGRSGGGYGGGAGGNRSGGGARRSA